MIHYPHISVLSSNKPDKNYATVSACVYMSDGNNSFISVITVALIIKDLRISYYQDNVNVEHKTSDILKL